MAVSKLSQIAAAGAPPAVTDQSVFVTGGTTDNLVTVTQLAAGLPVFTSTTRGSVPASGGSATTFLNGAGAFTTPSDTAGGSPGQVLFNNASVEAGMSGTSWDNTNLALTITGATVTTSNPILNLSQTWNAAVKFTGFLFNVTNTSSSATSLFQDWQVSGTSLFNVGPANTLSAPSLQIGTGSTTQQGWILGTQGSGVSGLWTTNAAVTSSNWIIAATGNSTSFFQSPIQISLTINGTAYAIITANSFGLTSGTSLNWNSGDLNLFRDAANILAQRNGTNANTFRVFNTFTDASNYERGVMDWTTNVNALTFGVQNAGTGSNRNLLFVGGGSTNFAVKIGSGIQIHGANPINWGSGDPIGTTQDVGISRTAAKVLGIGSGAAPDSSGWMQWAGEVRTTADFNVASNTTPANVTGLSVTLQASRNYTFHIVLLMVTGATAGGIKVQLGGTATVTNLIADGICVDGPTAVIINTTQVAVLATPIVANTNAGTTPKLTIEGTFEVNAAGTFTVQFSQNATNVTNSTVKRGSYMWVMDTP